MATESHPIALAPGKQITSWTATIRRWWVAFAASSVFVVCGHSLIKAGINTALVDASSKSAPPGIVHLAMQPQVLLGLFIYLLGTLCWMSAVAQKEISFLYPLTSVNYVMVAAASLLFFHETISARRAAGILVIVAGMILINRGHQKE